MICDCLCAVRGRRQAMGMLAGTIRYCLSVPCKGKALLAHHRQPRYNQRGNHGLDSGTPAFSYSLQHHCVSQRQFSISNYSPGIAARKALITQAGPRGRRIRLCGDADVPLQRAPVTKGLAIRSKPGCAGTSRRSRRGVKAARQARSRLQRRIAVRLVSYKSGLDRYNAAPCPTPYS